MNVNLATIAATTHGTHAAFHRQKECFNTNVTKSFERRIEELDRYRGCFRPRPS
jgi:hypothetical protein